MLQSVRLSKNCRGIENTENFYFLQELRLQVKPCCLGLNISRGLLPALIVSGTIMVGLFFSSAYEQYSSEFLTDASSNLSNFFLFGSVLYTLRVKMDAL